MYLFLKIIIKFIKSYIDTILINQDLYNNVNNVHSLVKLVIIMDYNVHHVYKIIIFIWTHVYHFVLFYII